MEILLRILYVVIGYVTTMFIYSHVLYGVFYFLPKAIYFVSKGELKPVAILRVLILPIAISIGLIVMGYVFAENETFMRLATSLQVALGSWLAIAILIFNGFVTKSGREKMDARFWGRMEALKRY